MGKRFLDAGLHIRFFKRVLALALASVLCWVVGEEVLPRPTSWDLLFYFVASILGVWSFFEGLAWLTKTLAIVVFKQPYEPVRQAVSPRRTSSKPEPAAIARCTEPFWDFQLDWQGDELTVSHKGKSWGKVFAPNLRGLTLGKQTLPLRALGPHLLEYRETLARSVSGDRRVSVLLQFDLENQSVRHHGDTENFGVADK